MGDSVLNSSCHGLSEMSRNHIISLQGVCVGGVGGGHGVGTHSKQIDTTVNHYLKWAGPI